MVLSNKEQKLANYDLKNISGGEIWRPKCPNCGVEIPGGESSAGKVITKNGCKAALFCKKCSELITEENFDNNFEFHTWQEGLATFGEWRRK